MLACRSENFGGARLFPESPAHAATLIGGLIWRLICGAHKNVSRDVITLESHLTISNREECLCVKQTKKT